MKSLSDYRETAITTTEQDSDLPGLDLALVEDWLEGLAIGAPPPYEFSRLGEGKSNLTYLVTDAAGSSWVLRRPPLGELLQSAHDVAREYRVLSRLADTAVPTPTPVALREPDPRLAVPLVLMEHLPGVVLDADPGVAGIDLPRRRAIGLSMATTLTKIHDVDIAAVGLADLASHKPYAERQLKRWSRQFEASKTRELPLVAELTERFRKAIPEQREVTLVHGDYHLRNVITDREDGAVVGILDWELCTLGDPLADLGGLLAYWPQADDPAPVPIPFSAEPGFPSRAEIVDAYADASGRDVTAVGFWEALGCWKVAIIGEGVLRRRLDDPANGDPAQSAEKVGLMLARWALAAHPARHLVCVCGRGRLAAPTAAGL
jgi:aminoglycoside phosphotransferase (APT) family kinase protein